jgi:hypothetical protein
MLTSLAAALCFFLIFDSVVLATDDFIERSDAIKTARPLIVSFVRRLVYSGWIVFSLGPHPFKDVFLLRGMIWLHLSLSTLVGVAACKCKDWNEFALFLAVDFFTFISRLGNFHVTCRKSRGVKTPEYVKSFHRWYNMGRVQPFGTLDIVTLRGFEVVVEEVTVTSVLIALILAYPVISTLPSDWIVLRQWFPEGRDNLAMAVVALLCSVGQDIIAYKHVGWESRQTWKSAIRSSVAKVLPQPFPNGRLGSQQVQLEDALPPADGSLPKLKAGEQERRSSSTTGEDKPSNMPRRRANIDTQSAAALLKVGGVKGIDSNSVFEQWLQSPSKVFELIMVSSCAAWMGAVLTYFAYWTEAVRLGIPGAAEWPLCGHWEAAGSGEA